MQQHTNSTLSILAIPSSPPLFQGCTLRFGFCMHIPTIMSAFYSIQQHTTLALSILAIFLPSLPFLGYTWGFDFCMHAYPCNNCNFLLNATTHQSSIINSYYFPPSSSLPRVHFGIWFLNTPCSECILVSNTIQQHTNLALSILAIFLLISLTLMFVPLHLFSPPLGLFCSLITY